MAVINFQSPLFEKAHNTFFRLNFRSQSRLSIAVTFVTYILISILLACVVAMGSTVVYKGITDRVYLYTSLNNVTSILKQDFKPFIVPEKIQR